MNGLREVPAQMLHDFQCVVVATFPLEHGFAVGHSQRIYSVMLAIHRHGFEMVRP
ncbi:hypothetical protein D3C87_2073120 [compost metagenome]